MTVDGVPEDFPQETLGAVTGAQPKLLVHKNERGQYESASLGLRAERWAICADLCEQLVDYVNKHVSARERAVAYADKVARSVEAKRGQWGLSIAEVEWVTEQLRARFQ